MTLIEMIPQNRHGRYCLPKGVQKRPAAQSVLSGKVFEPDTIAFMRDHAGQGDIIHAARFSAISCRACRMASPSVPRCGRSNRTRPISPPPVRPQI
jgi:hypothetical protein